MIPRLHMCTYICEIILKSRTNISMHTCFQLPFLKSLATINVGPK